jgi:pimeloyl-ACP methyl ester carboxylesterase
VVHEAVAESAPRSVVLVGYSYSGLIAGAVARGDLNDRLAGLVYVDAIVPEALVPEGQTRGDGQARPAGQDDRSADDLTRGVLALLGPGWMELLTPYPRIELPTTFISCTARAVVPSFRPIERSARVAGDLGWALRSIATSHRPMTEAPDELAGLLLTIELSQA